MRVARVLRFLASGIAALTLSACSGGGASDTNAASPAPAAQSACANAADCGNVYVAMTDADGDFLSYTVDVQSLTLKRADGTSVEALPVTTRVDFAQVVDLTEFLTAATVPNGVYVEGALRLDYSNAAITVESNGQPVAARAVGADGTALGVVDVHVVLDNRNHLTVLPGRPSLLTLDFDLAASNTVDLMTSPPTVTATPSLVASLEPVEEKDLRVRGPIVSVDMTAGSYVVDVRPFNLRDARLGKVTVHTDASTTFEVNGVSLTGADGLQALMTAGANMLTTAFGTLSTMEHRFDAQSVYAGTSVPGAGIDTLLGTVMSRSGNELIVRGGTMVRNDDGSATFIRDDVKVLVGANTRVFKNAVRPLVQLGANAISIGQRVQAFGAASQSNGEWTLDATQGRVRMHLTHLSGGVKEMSAGAITMDLASIDGRRISAFNFSGTGASPAEDADPANYEISTGLLGNNIALASGQPARVFGFVNPFGSAPPDFEARTVIDVRDLNDSLSVGWGRTGTTAPFTSADQSGLVLDLQNSQLGDRHYIRNGWQLVDVLSLAGSPKIVPADQRTAFVIVSRDACLTFQDFVDFASALGQRLTATDTLKSLTAHGTYDASSNVFTAHSVVAIL